MWGGFHTVLVLGRGDTGASRVEVSFMGFLLLSGLYSCDWLNTGEWSSGALHEASRAGYFLGVLS